MASVLPPSVLTPAVRTPPAARAAPVSQPGRRLRVLGVLAGITGPVLLAAYFAVPALVRWPQPGASARKLIAYATAHRLLFYGGGWLQATGALLSIVFFLVLLQLSGARSTLAGSATVTGCALLLSVVAIEAAMLEAVPSPPPTATRPPSRPRSPSATGCSRASSRLPRHRWCSPESVSPCPGPASCPGCSPVRRC